MPSSEAVTAGKLTGLLAGSDGLRTRELAQMSGGDPAFILALRKEQEDAGVVRRSGSRRGTRWHVIAGEQRVAPSADAVRARS